MKAAFVGFIISVLLSISCGQDGQVVEPNNTQNGSTMLFDNYEAEMAALWISGDLLAPEDLYADFDFGFTYIRATFGDSIPELNLIYFIEPWVPGEVICNVTTEAAQQIRAGEYMDMDSLNGVYGLTEVDTSSFFFGLWWVQLTFDEYYHPERLAEIYDAVPSVIVAVPNGRWYEPFNVYPWCIGGGTSYLFRNGWGDCPSGCIYNQFWYFWVVGNTVEYIGTWDTSSDPNPPAWWSYGQTAYYYYVEGYLPIGTGINE